MRLIRGTYECDTGIDIIAASVLYSDKVNPECSAYFENKYAPPLRYFEGGALWGARGKAYVVGPIYIAIISAGEHRGEMDTAREGDGRDDQRYR